LNKQLRDQREQLSEKEAEVKIMKKQRNEEKDEKIDVIMENKKLKVQYLYVTI
jgi:hypothetical protein